MVENKVHGIRLKCTIVNKKDETEKQVTCTFDRRRLTQEPFKCQRKQDQVRLPDGEVLRDDVKTDYTPKEMMHNLMDRLWQHMPEEDQRKMAQFLSQALPNYLYSCEFDIFWWQGATFPQIKIFLWVMILCSHTPYTTIGLARLKA